MHFVRIRAACDLEVGVSARCEETFVKLACTFCGLWDASLRNRGSVRYLRSMRGCKLGAHVEGCGALVEDVSSAYK
jgi:hypothetical protein